jgi:rubredoxin
MANIVAFDDVKATRTQRVVEGGKLAWRTNFMVATPEDPTRPQAFLAECGPHRVLRTHYHGHDQFQVFVAGGGTNGRHPIAPFQVHFSRAYTPYGPIVANEAGCAFLTLRTCRDAGARYLPETREELEKVPGRTPWQISRDVVFPQASAASACAPIEGVRDERGLAAHALSMAPGAEAPAPDPSGSNGQYIVVLGGSLIHEGREHKATTIVFVAPDEGPFRLTAGAAGLEAIALHFPLERAPEAPGAAPDGAPGEYRVWQCVLCSFVYDEAAGMPEEGIPPGTRWEDVPETWGCPDCSATKRDFEMVEI